MKRFLFIPLSSNIYILHQNIPNGNDMADAAQKHKKVEYGVHVSTLVNTVKYGASDITHSLGDNPYQRTG